MVARLPCVRMSTCLLLKHSGFLGTALPLIIDTQMATSPSRVSLGCISPVLRHCATGGWPRGFRRSQERSGLRGTVLCHSKTNKRTLLTGCWPLWFDIKGGMWKPCTCLDRENMKPFEGKHETLRVCLEKNRVRFGGQRRPYICFVILTALFP